ncbi:hypothetical protein [Streptomyces sp. NPDC049040]|uniref:hypothetical protein n=1 Tax=Streptomyces sp. NPDC049040 TaxID=3365593 RepID=UPI003715F47A
MDTAQRHQQPEDGPGEAGAAHPAAGDAPRPRLRERFTRGQLALRAAWAAGGLLLAYAAVAFLVRGMWLEPALLWVCPIVWVVAGGIASSTAEFWSEKNVHRARRVPARYVRTEPDPEYHRRFVQVYQAQTGTSRQVLWRRDSGKTADLAALPIRHVWLLPGDEEDEAVSTAGLVFMVFFLLVLLCAGLVFALAGLAGVGFCLVGPWLL